MIDNLRMSCGPKNRRKTAAAVVILLLHSITQCAREQVLIQIESIPVGSRLKVLLTSKSDLDRAIPGHCLAECCRCYREISRIYG